MKPQDFVTTYYKDALSVEKETGISALAILAQASWESGWGKSCPNFNFWGIKDTNGINGDEQLLQTTEYSRRPDLKFPKIISVTPVIRNGQNYFKYVVMDYFKSYNSVEESFKDHANFFLTNPRYSTALQYKSDPYKFLEEVAKAGYATDPTYAESMAKMINSIKKYIPQTGL